MNQIEIRAIESSEVAETVRMWRRSRDGVQPEIEARMGYSPSDDLAFFTNTILESCDVWVARRNRHVVGLLAIRGNSIEQLYVDPIEQRRGIGTLLLDFAKALSPSRLRLHTHQANEGARRFYERNGFRAAAFGVSPAPESEPDVRYEWGGASSRSD